MFTRERNTHAYLFGYARQLIADIPDERLAEQPSGIVNHPAWHLGHLCTAADLGMKLLGSPTLCPADWSDLFGRGSTPVADRAKYPTKAVLMNALEAGHGKFAAVVEAASPAMMDAVNPIERNRHAFPTLGDLIAYLLTGHEGIHLGQISAWRRASGLKSVQ
jgi:hypothetical protein